MAEQEQNKGTKRLALIGAGGMLASMVRRLAPASLHILPYDLPAFDLTDHAEVLHAMKAARPDIILNCAAYTNVDGCETQEEIAVRVNGCGAGYLAEAALATGALLVHISTDYVFNGRKNSPYTEEDPPDPLSAYGRSKLHGENAILASGLDRFFIVRTSWLYGPGGKNFVETIARLAAEREELRIVADQLGSPTFTRDLAEAIFNLLDAESAHGLYGIYHFANAGQCSWYEFAREIVAQLAGRGEPLRVRRILPIRTEEYPLPAPRPAYSVFSRDKYRQATGAEIPDWKTALADYLKDQWRNM